MVYQVSVFLENRAGSLLEILKTLAKGGINIRALSIAEVSDYGVLRIMVNDPEKARDILKASGHTASLTPVLVVEVPDRPGGLASVLEPLAENGINIEYTYAFVEKSGDNALVVLRIENMNEAARLLEKSGARILSAEEVYNL